MDKKEAQPLKEVIQEYLKAMKIEGKMKKVSLISSYEKVVGKTISRATKNIFFKGSTLIIELNSSVVRNELAMNKEKLIDLLNEEAGEHVIEKLVLK